MVDEDSRPLTNVIFLLGCDLVLSRPRPTRRGACLTSSGTSATGAAQPGGTLLSRAQGRACSSPLPPTTGRPIDTTDTKQALLARKGGQADTGPVVHPPDWCPEMPEPGEARAPGKSAHRTWIKQASQSEDRLADVVTKAHPEPHPRRCLSKLHPLYVARTRLGLERGGSAGAGCRAN